jgi:hypothetical protein
MRIALGLRALLCVIAVVLLGRSTLTGAALSHYERPTNGEPYKDRVIVFVHGIYGDAKDTWTAPNGAYWPKLLLTDDAFNDSDVYVAGYDSPYWGNTTTFEEIVTNLQTRLTADGVWKHREVVFVCHSMGGLLVRRLLIQRLLVESYKRDYAKKVPFIYFFATPETGVDLAKLASAFSSDPLLKILFPGGRTNDYLLNLEQEWREGHFSIHQYCAYEKLPYGRLGVIVPWDSATRNCTEPAEGIEADHVAIVKPKDKKDTPYAALRSATLSNPISVPVQAKSPPATPTHPDSRQRPETDKPRRDAFALELEGALYTDKRDGTNGFWIAKSGPIESTLHPANLTVFIRILSLLSNDVYIDSYHLEIQEGGKWFELQRLRGNTVYNAYPNYASDRNIRECLRKAIPLDFTETGLDEQLERKSAVLKAFEQIRGWAFYEYPPSLQNVTADPTLIRLTVWDSKGDCATHTDNEKGGGISSKVLLPKVRVLGPAVDISTWDIRRETDPKNPFSSPTQESHKECQNEQSATTKPNDYSNPAGASSHRGGATQQPSPTYSVTNPTGSIVNQNSPNYGTQTINNLPPSRLLDDDHADKLKTAMHRIGGGVAVFPDGTDQDVLLLGKQLCDIFRDAGMAVNCVDIPGYHTVMPVSLPARLTGIHCWKAHAEIQKAFNESGLPCVYHDEPFASGVSLGFLTIVIGNVEKR